jgi:uracil phosphoribosyltransferase
MVRTVVNHEFPQMDAELVSRMRASHPEGTYRGHILDPKTRVVCVNLARAGTVPSQICFEAFNYLLDPQGVRQDHISINRKVNDRDQVIGTQLGGLKIGGDIHDHFVVIPDPMGATGSTIRTAMQIYSQHGKARRYIAMHLIVTPEYLRSITREFPDLKIYAIRLDRGLSPKSVLNEIPGSEWEHERGLNEKHYIVPGAGGLGEVINNAFV